MQFHQLNVPKQKQSTRVGRGIAGGKGKTAGRGTKGQNSRTGGGVRPGFEGGQNPLAQRLPKLPGFRSIRTKPENIYTNQLNNLGANVDNFTLAKSGIISSPYVNVKLILKGDLTKKVNVKVQAVSKSATVSIEKLGGSVEIVTRPKREAKTKAELKA